MHGLLRRQIKRFLGAGEAIPPALEPLFDAIDATYHEADADRAITERSLEIASQEMLEQNQTLSNELKARREAESRLEYLTNFDSLTGLVNRNLLRDRLKHAMASAHRREQSVAVLVLGLDSFKMINESLGLGVGNELLKIISLRLQSSIRESDTVARLGGDEFALVLVEESKEGLGRQAPSGINISPSFALETNEISQRILTTVSESVEFEGRNVQITCSIGASFYPQDGDSVDELIQHAVAAMTSAKRQGRNNFQFYTSDLSEGIHERLAIQAELRLALEREEFVLHYQPQVDLRSGSIVGMESLIRWNHPVNGLVPPARFIGISEETGLIVPIGAWVIRTAAYQSIAWKQVGYGNIRVAVNLSAREFAQPDLAKFVARVLAETGMDPNFFEIELTESMVMANVERAVEILHELKALGVLLSIDDFGTGYSSLSYLKRFPIDVLKIDQSFVRDMQYDSGDQAIVKAIISMAHSLGIRVIAEGVETEAQCEFLRANMCDEMQGFLFSKGLPHDEASLMLHEKRRLPEGDAFL